MIGARVVVPLGSRVVTGIVVDDDHAPDRTCAEGSAVKPIREVLDAEAFVPADVDRARAWTAEYYAAGAGRGDYGASCRRRREARGPTRTRPSASRRSPPRVWSAQEAAGVSRP